jgi:ribonuclease VapC
MVIDTSAIAAILFDEPERADFIAKIVTAPVRLISAPTLLECQIVVEARKGERGRAKLALFMYESELTVVAFDQTQVDFASLAWRRYGKGRHAAGLNYGDCFAYALAKATGEPLLFKKFDFSQTDTASC